MLEIAKTIIGSSVYCALFPLVLALYKRKFLSPPLQVIFIYLLLIVGVQAIAKFTAWLGMNNLPLLHVYTIAEFSLLCWFYQRAIPALVSVRTMSLCILLFLAWALWNACCYQGWYQFNTNARTPEGIAVLIFALLYYYAVMREMKILRLEDEPLFWINTGFMLYFSGGTLLFFFSNVILSFAYSLNMYIWALHASFSVILYLFLAIGIWKVPIKPT